MRTQALAAGFAAALLAQVLLAQDPAMTMIPQRGLVPTGTYLSSNVDSVDAVGGNVNIHIPLATLPAGPGGFLQGVDLYYNSAIYTKAQQSSGLLQVVPTNGVDLYTTGGWRYGFQYSLEQEVAQFGIGCTQAQVARYYMILPDGSSHVLLPVGTGTNDADYPPGYFGFYLYGTSPCGGTGYPGGNFISADGSFLNVSVTVTSGYILNWTLHLPNGTVVGGMDDTTTSITDRNGSNPITIGTTAGAYGSGTTTLTDVAGRTIQIATATDTSGNRLTDTITQSGYNSAPLTWTVNWGTVTIPNDGSHQYNCNADIDCTCGSSTDTCISQQEITSINLPDSLEYQFSYSTADPTGTPACGTSNGAWGQLSSMTLPTGAQVAYTYDTDWDYSCVTSGFIKTRTLTWTDEDQNVTRTEETMYSISATSSTIRAPDGGTTTNGFYNTCVNYPVFVVGTSCAMSPFAGLVYQTTLPDGSDTEEVWAQSVPYGVPVSGIRGYPLPGSPYVQASFRSAASGGSPLIATMQGYVYDRNGNATNVTQSDWFPYTNIAHGTATGASTPVATGASGAVTLKTTATTYVNGAGTAIGASSGTTTSDSNGYWAPPSPYLLNLPARATVSGAGPGSVTEFQYDASSCGGSGGALTHGNLTALLAWDSSLGAVTTPLTSGNADVTRNCYDSYGNLTSTTNPRGNPTTITYYSGGICPDSVVIDGVRHFTYGPCDSGTDLPQYITDNDHNIQDMYSYDSLGRKTKTVETGNGGLARNQTIALNDSLRTVAVASDLNAQTDGLLTNTTWTDQLGRTRQTQDAALNKVQTEYLTPQSTGYSYRAVSNPYATGQSSIGWSLTQFDTSGRAVQVQQCGQTASTPAITGSGSTTCNATSVATVVYGAVTSPINASAVTTTTAAPDGNVAKVSYYDGLGRLVEVVQSSANNEATTYTYDVLGNITGVSQQNVNARTFAYNSLSRLVSATTPESYLTCYRYDPDGNLSSRTYGASSCPSSGGVTTNYTYNPLDLLTSRTYTDSTPSATLTYNVDWLTGTSSGVSTTQYSTFDGFGRVTASSQAPNGGPTYSFSSYSWDLADDMTSVTMPSGRIVATTFNNAAQPTQVQGTFGSAITTYLSQTAYAPQGALMQGKLGNNLYVQAAFNSQLQTTAVNLGTSSSGPNINNVWGLANQFGGSGNNNGNVAGQVVTVPGVGSLTTAYHYDGYDRIMKATENASNPTASSCAATFGQWCRFYDYNSGGNGNRAVMDNSGDQSLLLDTPATFNANNQIADSGWQYDGRGNVIKEYSGATFAYDAENRMIAFCPNDSSPTTCVQTFGNQRTLYYYDGAGKRVEVTGPAQTSTFVYDAAGNLAAEYDSMATAQACTTCYVTTDHLGTTRVITDGNGCAVYRADYLPFGEQVLVSSSDTRMGANGGPNCNSSDATSGYPNAVPLREQFTGQERDSESGLDYFQARSYSSAGGRFQSADPLAVFVGDPGTPQSWNMYGYVFNNPMKFIDPTGLCSQDSDGNFNDSDDGGGTFLYGGACATDNGTLQNGATTSANVTDSTPQLNYDSADADFGYTFFSNSYLFQLNVPGNVPPGEPQKFQQPLRQGFDYAQHALQRKSCANLYGGLGPQTLNATLYRFLDLQDPTVGAATMSPTSVFINSNGPFMTYMPQVGQAGPFGRFWTQAQFRGFILLHELGHQLSSVTDFQPDRNSPLNAQQSNRVLRACF